MFADDRGSIAILAAFLMLVLVVVAGVTIDVTQVFTMRARLQSAADGAALTGAVVARDTAAPSN